MICPLPRASEMSALRAVDGTAIGTCAYPSTRLFRPRWRWRGDHRNRCSGSGGSKRLVQHFHKRIAVVRVLLPLVELHEHFDGFADRDLGFALVRGDHVAALGIWLGQRLQYDGRYLVGFLVPRAVTDPRDAHSLGGRPGNLRIVIPRLDDAYPHAER